MMESHNVITFLSFSGVKVDQVLYYHFWFPFQVMDFINDAIVSMDAFVTAYESAAVFFSCPVEMRYLFKPCIVQFIY